MGIQQQGGYKGPLVDRDLWNVIQEVRLAGVALSKAHTHVLLNGRFVPAARKQAELDNNAEFAIVKKTGDQVWRCITLPLSKIKPQGKPAEQAGKYCVPEAQLEQYDRLRQSMTEAVTTFQAMAFKRKLYRAGSVAKGQEEKPVTYRGPHLGVPLTKAFNALRRWEKYEQGIRAKNIANNLIARVSDPNYQPTAPQNTLALPAPSVPSQPPSPPMG